MDFFLIFFRTMGRFLQRLRDQLFLIGTATAATAISKKILEEGQPAADNYIKFLKSGGCDYPVELLKLAGVDMSTPEPIEAAMATFEELLDELERLVG